MFMFRKLMGYCVTSIASCGYCSFAMQHTTTATYINISFWSVNVFHRVHLCSAPRGMLLPGKILISISSYLSLFDVVPTCVSFNDVSEKLGDCLFSYLPGKQQPTVVRTFALSTTQFMTRHDYRTIMDSLLMKLRRALDQDLLKKIPLIYKVIYFIRSLKTLYFRDYILFFSLFPPGILLRRGVCYHRKSLRPRRDHLNPVARLSTYRFHMREVIFFPIDFLFF